MKRLLVAEDSATQREQLVALLEDAGYAVQAARDGAAALELARRHAPDLVVTDVVMPHMDGYELCRAIKGDAALRDTPVILLTSLSSPHDVVQGLACGADNFVRKPYEAQSLLARVARCLTDTAAQRGLAVADAAPGRHGIVAEREQALEFLFSTFEEAQQLDGELTRSYASLDLLYRLAEGLNRSTTEREVVLETLARALELPGVHGAWLEIAGERLAGASGSCAGIGSLAQAPPADHGVILRSGNQVLGVLQLVGPTPDTLDDDVLRTLEGVGHQVGAALERALLQEHLEQRVQERTAALTAEIAARRRAEEALRAMAAIVESADDGMVRLAPDGSIETWNRGAARLYGYVGDEAVGRSIELLTPPELVGEVHAVIARAACGESVQGYETVRLTRDGRRIDVSLTLSPVRDEAGAIVAVAEITRDITEAKTLEAALRQSQKLESVGRLAGGIAHDFNNLLTGVIGFSDLTLARLEPEHVVRPYVEEVKRAGERATALTQQLLAFGRRQTLRPQSLDLNTVVGELEPLLQRLIGDSVEMRFKLADARCPLHADRGQLEQIVMNLALNARDAMPHGGRMTIATSRAAALERGEFVRLTVTDTGVGMDADTQAHIFEPFFTTKPEGKGTGLGLSTVFGIVRQNDGLITVDSEVGRGTTFSVFLPCSDEAPVADAGGEAAGRPASGSGTVLVVEDDAGVRALVQRVLESGGYTVRATGDPQAALELAREPFDLLLTDMRMPGMTGSELAARLPGRRVLYMSGYTGEDIADAEHFLAKPFTPSELLERVGGLLS